MAKLRLNLDQLTVDSFDTAGPRAKKGTVFGEQCTCWTYCGQNTCPGCPTCNHTECNQHSCQESCEGTCYGTCPPEYSCWDTCAGQYTCESVTGNQIICQC
jgi:hypothetical protein